MRIMNLKIQNNYPRKDIAMKYRKSIIYAILAAVFILVAILFIVSLAYYSHVNNGATISLAKGPLKYILLFLTLFIL